MTHGDLPYQALRQLFLGDSKLLRVSSPSPLGSHVGTLSFQSSDHPTSIACQGIDKGNHCRARAWPSQAW